jgi:hypothetical protein
VTRRGAVSAEQLDLFAELDAALAEAEPRTRAEAPVPSLYDSPTRGLAARIAEFEAWQDEHGTFASLADSHAWHAGLSHPTAPTDRCMPSVLLAEFRCLCVARAGRECMCVGDLMYRGACRHCEWEGTPTDHESTASEDANDHAFPGWRDLPVVPRYPVGSFGPAQRERVAAKWLDTVRPMLPAGWLEAGGPVRTKRCGVGTRHVPGGTPCGGYDMAAGEDTP